jgi:hypothetical protein
MLRRLLMRRAFCANALVTMPRREGYRKDGAVAVARFGEEGRELRRIR